VAGTDGVVSKTTSASDHRQAMPPCYTRFSMPLATNVQADRMVRFLWEQAIKCGKTAKT
jgi:hypothetical protein